jgi:hypothetical protein
MPQRQAIITVPSDVVQGPESWVKVRAVTHGKAQEMKRLATALLTATDANEKLRLQQAVDEAGVQLIIDHVFDWNWVNEAGEPLPLPRRNPAILDELLEMENDFLDNAVAGTVKAPKNS